MMLHGKLLARPSFFDISNFFRDEGNTINTIVTLIIVKGYKLVKQHISS